MTACALYNKDLAGMGNGDLSRLLKKHLRGKFMQMFGSSWGMSMDMRMSYQYGEHTYIKTRTEREFLS